MLGKCSASPLITAALRADHHSFLIIADTKHKVISIHALPNNSQPPSVLLQVILMHKIMHPDPGDCSFLLTQSFII